jgi:26S proteasome regulatory subunit N1
LEEKINSREDYSKLGSIVGLGLAYAGSGREDLLDLLLPVVIDNSYSNECSALAALSLGLIFVGKCNEDVGNGIYQALTEKDEAQLNMSISRYFGVALGLLFLAKQEKCEAILEAIKTISHPISKYIEICIESCAYVGSGNVLKVQQFFHHCVFQEETDKEGKEGKEPKEGAPVNLKIKTLIQVKTISQTKNPLIQNGWIGED